MAAGNNVLDGEAMDDLSTKLKKCEDRLSAVEDFNEKVGFIVQMCMSVEYVSLKETSFELL